MAPMPAPIPTANAIRRSCEFNLKMSPIVDPKPAPISATGPSRPALPPEPIVIAEATNFTRGMRRRMNPSLLWKLFIAASVPCPSASGASLKTSNPLINPPIVQTTGIIQLRVITVRTVCPSPPGAGGMYPANLPRSNHVTPFIAR